jgi:hypothetical protein
MFVPTLVVRLDLVPEEFAVPTTLKITVDHDDGERLIDLGYGFTYQPAPIIDERLSTYQVIIQPLLLQLRRDGKYLVQLTRGSSVLTQLSFVVARTQLQV